jgi:hypothetical protein
MNTNPPIPRTVVHTHDGKCLVISATGNFACTVTLLPLSIIGRAPTNLAPEAYSFMATLASLSPAARAADYSKRYGAAVAAATGTP